ncbi:MAG: hypothetical protein AAF560_09230 [Acidobacteriota bacterium]
MVASIRTQKGTVSEELNQLFDGVLQEGEQMPDWGFVQELHARLLDRSNARVAAIDQEHRTNLADLGQARVARNRWAKGLQSRIRALRNLFRGTYGEEALGIVGLDQPPERKALAVLRQAGHIRERLRNPELALPDLPSGFPALEAAPHIADIEAAVASLEASLAAIDQQRKVVDESLVSKRHELKQHQHQYMDVARNQEAYYRLAGLDDLAERIRPFARRPRRSKPEAAPAPEASQPDVDGTPEAEGVAPI